jgi:hypothetical protein
VPSAESSEIIEVMEMVEMIKMIEMIEIIEMMKIMEIIEEVLSMCQPRASGSTNWVSGCLPGRLLSVSLMMCKGLKLAYL